FDGTAWVNVGTPGFSEGDTYYTSLAFSPSGEPYVVYMDWANSFKATVMKFDGSNWVNVGIAGFSEFGVEFTSIAFGPNGEPYVAYRDYANSLKATVMKFDGSNWVFVGTPGFSAGTASYNSLAFSPSGEPYVAYRDNGNSNKATVMKFVDSNMGISEVGSQPKIAVYPNPTNGQINFSMPANAQLTNIAGQVVANKTNTSSLDLTNLPSGVYFLTLTNDNRQIIQRSKIVKE
ncbi:MAG: T9SS type A sorting domain-containing protein, partial [Firmicutes bacterium]|nr:T9SS type A sorting domain-containing protein [Bacillota bacterium]